MNPNSQRAAHCPASTDDRGARLRDFPAPIMPPRVIRALALRPRSRTRFQCRISPDRPVPESRRGQAGGDRRIGGQGRRQRAGRRARRPAPAQRLARRHRPAAAPHQRRVRHAHHCRDHRLSGAGAGRCPTGRADLARRQDCLALAAGQGARPPLSGADWWNANRARYPNSAAVADLAQPFRDNVAAFLKALKDAGASVTISATRRNALRAQLMHYSWRVAKELVAPNKVPALPRPGYPVGPWRPRQVEGRRAGDVRPVPDRLRALAHVAPISKAARST